MPYSVVSLPLGSGLDSKTDPKALQPPKVILLQDCIFTNINRISKRNGYMSLPLAAKSVASLSISTLSSPKMTATLNNELLCASNGRLWSLSESGSYWVDRGQYSSIAVSKNIISTGNATNSSCAVSGNYALFTYDIPTEGTADVVKFSYKDLSTGTFLYADDVLANAFGYSRSVLLGASTLAALFLDNSGNLSIRVFSAASNYPSIVGTLQTVVAAASFATPYCYDVATTSTGAVIAYSDQSGTNVKLVTIDTTGAVTHTATISSAGKPSPVSVTNDHGTGNNWIYWADSNTSENSYYAVYSSILSVVLGKTLISSSLATCQQMTSYVVSSTQQVVLISTWQFTGNSGTTSPNKSIQYAYPSIQSFTVNTSGTVVGPTIVTYNADLYSKPISINGNIYVAVVSISPSEPTGFLLNLNGIGSLDLNNVEIVAKFLPFQAEGIYWNDVSDSVVISSVRMPGFLENIFNLSSNVNQFLMCSGYVSTLVPVVLQYGPQGNVGPASPSGGGPSLTLGLASIVFDFNNIDSFQAIPVDNSLVLNGGIVSLYDGSQVAELGFNLDPDNILVKATSSGGSIGTGTYTYYVVYEWYDVNGNIYQSAPSNAFIVNMATGSSNKSTVIIPALSLTTKQAGVSTGVTIVLYRTQNGGTIAYRTNSTSDILPSIGGSVTINDLLSDAELVGNSVETLYTEGGAILENITPPPAMVMWTNNNRVWVVDSESPNTTIEYSKTSSQGTGISFSTGQLELVIDSKFGPITAGSQMDEKTVIFKQNGLGYFLGDGANDAGTGSTITSFQFIPSDVGCTNSKSAILFPNGIMFKSQKGIYLISRGIQVGYIGMDVEAYNSQDIQSSFLISSKSQIRFLTSSGFSLLYDYIFQKWSIFTNHTGLSGCSFQGNYTYVRTDGSIYEEDQTGTYLDNASSFAPLIQLSWLKASSIQGFERIRRIMLLGDFQTANNGHGVQISAAYDFGSGFSSPVPFIFTGSNGVYQYRERISRQKADSIQFLIQEIVTGASGEFIDLTDFSIEILNKTGLNKLPGSRSVG